jgi:hypothetical protein
VREDGGFYNPEVRELLEEFNEISTPYIPRENFIA